jgi:YVTN family beta-propeller protein
MLLYAGPVIRVREILKKTVGILRAASLKGRSVRAGLGVAGVFCSFLPCCPAAGAFTHFEARQMHPLTLTPDGKHLLAVNSTEGRLSVFDVSDASNVNPVLVAEIPVGLEPVSVAAPTNDEAWVVNEVSDTVSVVSLSRRIVVATLPASDEPSDVVFAKGRAFVSCARNKLIRVFDMATRAQITSIPVNGIEPRALAVDSSGERVYSAFLLSGNRTTVLLPANAPAQPAPTNPELPAPPKTALIVPTNDSRIAYTVLDHDVAEIDTNSLEVTRYFGDVGTAILNLAVHPVTGEPWVANIESHNLVRFEPKLRGHVADHRLARLNRETGVSVSFDLNPGTDYEMLPNPQARESALAEPRDLIFSRDGTKLWVAAFASDRVACVDSATGQVISRVSLRPEYQGPRRMRGPRGLAWQEERGHLFVLNKLSDTISVIQTATSAVLTEVPLASYDPMPTEVREGRGFLYDARLSGNGTISCATCHLDADRDGIAWDLGDPGGKVIVTTGTDIGFPGIKERQNHPMKGPMVTQTLRGMAGKAPFHWRGDKADIVDFNPTFPNLLAADLLPEADMTALRTYLLSINLHPNPNLQRDGSLPAQFDRGDPRAGKALFESSTGNCFECHAGAAGTNNNIDSRVEVGSSQPVKNASLSTVYQRLDFDSRAGKECLSGFGLIHDGTGFSLPIGHPYVLDSLSTFQQFYDVIAYVKCFPTGTLPAIGASFTITAQNQASAVGELSQMEDLARNSKVDFVVRGLIGGRPRSFIFRASTGTYHSDIAGEPATDLASLVQQMNSDDILNFLSTAPGEGERFVGDRNEDGRPDGDEEPPILAIRDLGAAVRLEWPQAADWVLERADDTRTSPWSTVTGPRTQSGPVLQRDEPLQAPANSGFFRLRRTW